MLCLFSLTAIVLDYDKIQVFKYVFIIYYINYYIIIIYILRDAIFQIIEQVIKTAHIFYRAGVLKRSSPQEDLIRLSTWANGSSLCLSVWWGETAFNFYMKIKGSCHGLLLQSVSEFDERQNQSNQPWVEPLQCYCLSRWLQTLIPQPHVSSSNSSSFMPFFFSIIASRYFSSFQFKLIYLPSRSVEPAVLFIEMSVRLIPSSTLYIFDALYL